jgi:hypothetical protein
MNKLTKDDSQTDADEIKWLKTIIPADYLNLTLESTAQKMNATNQRNADLLLIQNSSMHNGNKLQIQATTTIVNSQSGEVIETLIKDLNQDQEAHKVLVVNINDKNLDCPGMIVEEKFMSDTLLNTNNKSTGGVSFFFNSKNGKKKSSKIKREKDDLSSRHEGSVVDEVNDVDGQDEDDDSLSSDDDDNVQDNIDVTGVDNIEDDVEDLDEIIEANQMQQMLDVENESNLSDFDRLSNRDTPIISGRDTPSSHSHEDLLNISSSRGNSQNNQSMSANLTNMNSQTLMIMMNGGGVGGVSSSMNPMRGPQGVPITVQKPNREDINDKFCKFEINKGN